MSSPAAPTPRAKPTALAAPTAIAVPTSSAEPTPRADPIGRKAAEQRDRDRLFRRLYEPARDPAFYASSRKVEPEPPIQPPQPLYSRPEPAQFADRPQDDVRDALPNGTTKNDMLYWNQSTGRWVVLGAPSATGTFVLGVVDGTLQWMETTGC